MQMRNIIICGLPGCGKTATAALLARKMDRNVYDTDALMEKKYRDHNTALTIREIHNTLGEGKFRALEAETIKALRSIDLSIISIGGGTLTTAGNATMLKEMGIIIYLKGDRTQIYDRLIALKGLPTYLDIHAPRLSFERLAEIREKDYASLASVKFDITNLTLEEVVEILANTQTLTNSTKR